MGGVIVGYMYSILFINILLVDLPITFSIESYTCRVGVKGCGEVMVVGGGGNRRGFTGGCNGSR